MRPSLRPLWGLVLVLLVCSDAAIAVENTVRETRTAAGLAGAVETLRRADGRAFAQASAAGHGGAAAAAPAAAPADADVDADAETDALLAMANPDGLDVPDNDLLVASRWGNPVRAITAPIASVVKPVTKPIANVAVVVKDSTVSAAVTVKDGTVDTANTVKDGTVDTANTVKDGTVDTANTVKDGTVDAANTVKDGTVDAANTVADAAVDAANAVAATAESAAAAADSLIDRIGGPISWAAGQVADGAKLALDFGLQIAQLLKGLPEMLAAFGLFIAEALKWAVSAGPKQAVQCFKDSVAFASLSSKLTNVLGMEANAAQRAEAAGEGAEEADEASDEDMLMSLGTTEVDAVDRGLALEESELAASVDVLAARIAETETRRVSRSAAEGAADSDGEAEGAAAELDLLVEDTDAHHPRSSSWIRRARLRLQARNQRLRTIRRRLYLVRRIRALKAQRRLRIARANRIRAQRRVRASVRTNVVQTTAPPIVSGWTASRRNEEARVESMRLEGYDEPSDPISTVEASSEADTANIPGETDEEAVADGDAEAEDAPLTAADEERAGAAAGSTSEPITAEEEAVEKEEEEEEEVGDGAEEGTSDAQDSSDGHWAEVPAWDRAAQFLCGIVDGVTNSEDGAEMCEKLHAKMQGQQADLLIAAADEAEAETATEASTESMAAGTAGASAGEGSAATAGAAAAALAAAHEQCKPQLTSAIAGISAVGRALSDFATVTLAFATRGGALNPKAVLALIRALFAVIRSVISALKSVFVLATSCEPVREVGVAVSKLVAMTALAAALMALVSTSTGGLAAVVIAVLIAVRWLSMLRQYCGSVKELRRSVGKCHGGGTTVAAGGEDDEILLSAGTGTGTGTATAAANTCTDDEFRTAFSGTGTLFGLFMASLMLVKAGKLKGSGKSAQLARNRRVAKHIGMEDGIAEAQEHATDAVSAANDDSEDVLVATRAAARSADDAELDAAFASRVGPGLTPPSAEASREYFDHAMRKRDLSATEIANGLLVATMKGLKSIGNALASVF